MSEDLTAVECIFVGQRMLSDGKLAEGYITVEKADEFAAADWDVFEREVSLFGGGKKPRGRDAGIVGGVYSMKVKLEDGRISSASTGSRSYVRRYPEPQAIAAWEIRDNAAKQNQRRKRMLAKAKEDSYVDQELVALRRLYMKTPYADRTAFEMMVLHRIRNGGK